MKNGPAIQFLAIGMLVSCVLTYSQRSLATDVIDGPVGQVFYGTLSGISCLLERQDIPDRQFKDVTFTITIETKDGRRMTQSSAISCRYIGQACHMGWVQQWELDHRGEPLSFPLGDGSTFTMDTPVCQMALASMKRNAKKSSLKPEELDKWQCQWSNDGWCFAKQEPQDVVGWQCMGEAKCTYKTAQHSEYIYDWSSVRNEAALKLYGFRVIESLTADTDR
jgi:hypothetical protein